MRFATACDPFGKWGGTKSRGINGLCSTVKYEDCEFSLSHCFFHEIDFYISLDRGNYIPVHVVMMRSGYELVSHPSIRGRFRGSEAPGI